MLKRTKIAKVLNSVNKAPCDLAALDFIVNKVDTRLANLTGFSDLPSNISNIISEALMEKIQLQRNKGK